MDEERPERAAARLISAQRWLALATIGADGAPLQSYFPFAVAGAAFAIVASRLAAHTANLLARRPAALMIVAADGPAPDDAYARPRLSIGVTALPHARGSADAAAIWSALASRHRAASLLQSLPDFEAIALAPTGGRLILGFAAAHDLDATALRGALRPAEA